MTSKATQRNPVERLAEEFLARYRRGERPSLSEYVRNHPELAVEIRQVFPALVLMEQAGPPEIDLPRPCRGRAPERLGDYRILREIGRGGMGIVYEAEQESLGRHVALKVLPLQAPIDAVRLQRFRREAKSAARLHHTNIVPVFEVGEHDGTHYYAMQFILGHGLDEVLLELRRLRGARCGAGVEAEEPGDNGDQSAMRNLTMRLATRLVSEQFAAAETGLAENQEAAFAKSVPEGEASRHSEQAASRITEREYHSGDGDVRPGATEPQSRSDRPSSDLTTQSDFHYYRSVARLGLQVAEALAYAHGQKILHRDIKPSNLLLDLQGTVWVTDFGLAKEEGDDLTQTGDLVGTLRYMAPERFNGTADATSDVYSLGLTLYELLTLRPAYEESDRGRLIKQVTQEEPPAPRKLDSRIPRDLETIILKSIKKEPGQRYASAAALAEDLKRFLADLPIQARRTSVREHVWRWSRRNPILASMTVSVAALLATVAVIASVSALWLRDERNATRDQLHLTEQAEAKAKRELYSSLLAQARASRWSGRPGQRFDSLQAITEAARLVAPLELGPADVLELRNEAIASMTLADMHIGKQLEGNLSLKGGIAFDARLEHYARSDEQGNISVRRVADEQELIRLPGPGCGAPLMRFSADGEFLAAKYHLGLHGNPKEHRLWHWRKGQLIVPEPCDAHGGFDFSPDNRRIAFGGRQDGSLRIFDTGSGQEVKRFELGYPLHTIAFHPNGEQFAVSGSPSGEVQIWGARTGKVMFKLPHETLARGLAWRGDGRFLAVGSFTGPISIWDMERRRLHRTLIGHTKPVLEVAFNHGGDLLASRSWDGTTRLWDPMSGRQLVVGSDSRTLQFSSDDRWLACKGVTQPELWEVAGEWACRSLYGHDLGDPGAWCVDFSPDGRLLASSSKDGVRLWDTLAAQEVAHLPCGLVYSVLFHPDGASLFTSGSHGLHRWPIRRFPTQDATVVRIDLPQHLDASPLGRASRDGACRQLAVVRASQQPLIVDLDRPGRRTVLPVTRQSEIVISPNGTRVATVPWGASGVTIWDTVSSQPLHELPINAGATSSFSPDNRWLCTPADNQYVLWDAQMGKRGPTIQTEAMEGFPGRIAFTSDSSLMAIVDAHRQVKLISMATFEEIATLPAPDPQPITWLAFSSGGSQLAAATDSQVIQKWDLRFIRKQLAAMNLDWNLPPFPAAEESADLTPLRVEVEPGNIPGGGRLNPSPTQLRRIVALSSLVLAVNPLDFHAYLQRAEAHVALEQTEDAIDDYNAALCLMPTQSDPVRDPAVALACNNLAWARVVNRGNVEDVPKILFLAQKAVELAPSQWLYRNTLGVVYYRLGRYPEAIESLERSLADAKGEGAAFNLFFLAMCHHQQGDAVKARDCYDRATRWVSEHQAKLLPHWVPELAAFHAEAAALLGIKD